MNYEVHIKDTQNYSDPLVLHFAERGSITLNHLGGDDKTQPIVGSELVFTLENYDSADAKYSEYFTSDEKRFEVTQVYHDTQEVIWKGYLLPESYSEPYTKNVSYISFSATDGLGLLKGKRLPAEYYQEEKTVMQVIAACLELTNEDFEIWLSPAIRNHLKRKWHEIYIDGLKWFDEDKNPSAYDFLEELIFSMRCQLYQANNRWFIEGINKRQLITQTFDVYNPNGQFLNVQEFTKRVIELDLAPEPNITTVPAYKEVIVSHEAAQLKLAKDVYQEEKINWVKATGVVDEFRSRYWVYRSNFVPRVIGSDYYLSLDLNPDLNATDQNRKIVLNQPPYILKGWKIKIEMDFELYFYYNLSQTVLDPIQEAGNWRNLLKYRISLNGNSVFDNLNATLQDDEFIDFDKSRRGDVALEFVATENGFLQIEFFQPYGVPLDIYTDGISVTNLSIENIEQKENFIYTELLDLEASTTKDFELPVSDDVSAWSKCFQLEKIRNEVPVGGYTVSVNILYHYLQYGKRCYVVSLKDAVLIEQFAKYTRMRVTIGGNTVFISNIQPLVTYNFLNGEEMVIQVESENASQHIAESFSVEIRKYADATIDRTEWAKWTDDVYGVEKKPYNQVAAEIERRLFSEQHLRWETDAYDAVFFNDIVKIDYAGQIKYYVPTNCSWNSDEGISSVMLIEGVYSGASTGNIPPYVDAGDNKILQGSATSVFVTNAVATDPDGVIQSLTWQKLQGDGNPQFGGIDPLNPYISGLTGNYYLFELSATDNSGATATDTMEVLREENYSIQFDLLSETETTTGSYVDLQKIYKLSLDPDMPANYLVNLDFEVYLQMVFNSIDLRGSSQVIIRKNGVEIYNTELGNEGDLTENDYFSYIVSSDIEVEINLSLEELDPNGNPNGYCAASFVVNGYSFTAGQGVVNVPEGVNHNITL